MAKPQSAPAPAAPESEVSRSPYLTRQEAARHLNVPPSWLANNAKRGPRFIKVGGLVRYTVEALDAYMSANECRR
jgi:hypothetical protein